MHFKNLNRNRGNRLLTTIPDLITTKCIPDCKTCSKFWTNNNFRHTIICKCKCHNDNSSDSDR